MTVQAGTSTRTGSQQPSSTRLAAVMVGVLLIWGLGVPVAKLISAPALVSTSVRFWFAAPILLAVATISGRPVSIRTLRQTAPAGLFFASNLVFVFVALQHASVAVVAVIVALQPAVVLVVAGRWMGERSTVWHKVWTGVAVLGVVIVVLGGDSAIAGDGMGVLCAVGSLLMFVAYHLSNRRGRTSDAMDPITWLAGATLSAALCITPVALALSSRDDFGQLGGTDWLYLGFMAVVVGMLGHGAMSWAHKYVPATRSSLYLLGMNVVSIVAAWPIHHEPIGLVQAAGCAIVLGAVGAVISRSGSVVVETSAAGDIAPP